MALRSVMGCSICLLRVVELKPTTTMTLKIFQLNTVLFFIEICYLRQLHYNTQNHKQKEIDHVYISIL